VKRVPELLLVVDVSVSYNRRRMKSIFLRTIPGSIVFHQQMGLDHYVWNQIVHGEVTAAPTALAGAQQDSKQSTS
jgi:hypothetical protein